LVRIVGSGIRSGHKIRLQKKGSRKAPGGKEKRGPGRFKINPGESTEVVWWSRKRGHWEFSRVGHYRKERIRGKPYEKRRGRSEAGGEVCQEKDAHFG